MEEVGVVAEHVFVNDGRLKPYLGLSVVFLCLHSLDHVLEV